MVLHPRGLKPPRYTSFTLSLVTRGLSTPRLPQRLRPSRQVAGGGRTAVLKIPGALPVEGGIPLMADGKIIGAIGVSGGTSQQDAQVAQAGVAALEAMLKGK